MDSLVAQLAQTQDGQISRQQLLALGATDEWVAARLKSGRWQRVFAGTYATFTGPLPFEAHVSAALLRAGTGSMARARTAAALYGLVIPGPGPGAGRPIELLLPHHRRVRVEPVIRVRYSQDADRRRNPLRSPAREWVEDVVLDLAEQCRSLNDVAGWVSRANAKMLTDPRRLLDALSERGRHRWRTELIAMLGDVALGAHSPLEIRYLNRVERAHGLPTPDRQRVTPGPRLRFVDIEHVEFSTRVELDGRIGHEHEGAFRDRRRDNDGVRAGQATLRYGWGEVFQTPCAVAVEVGSVLQSRGWTGKLRRCGEHCLVRP